MKTIDITKQAVIAAVYVAVSLLLFPLAYMDVQFRFSEILVMLPFFNKKHTIGLTVGCFITNIFSPVGLPDMIFGTLATLIVCLIVSQLKTKNLIGLIAALFNGVIIGLELYFVFDLPFWLSAVTVFIGELVVVQMGILMAVVIERNTYLVRIFK